MTQHRLNGATALACILVMTLVGASCSSSDDAAAGGGSTTSVGADGYPESGPPGDEPQTIDRADVDRAVEALGPVAEAALAETGVPGMSVAIVFEDEVVFTGGYGVREVGTDEAVDADTAFQLASLSKPVGATVMASMVGDEVIAWDQPIAEVDPAFALADPATTEMLTFGDLYSHRSGLPPHAGDLVEDIGFDRATVLERLRYYPLDPFRATYAYTNFGMTEAAVAAASADGAEWEDVSEARLYEPLGMTNTSSRSDDYLARTNRAVPHMRGDDGSWIVTDQQRDPDAQTPAGGVSSTAKDLAQWLRLEINEGRYDGEQLVDAEALLAAQSPQMITGSPRSATARSGFYGYGMNVSFDDAGRKKLSHSGAFLLGAATAFGVLTNEHLGIVVLTNGQPVGLPEVVVESFLDLATGGEVRRDWLGLFGGMMQGTLYPEPEVDYSVVPAEAVPERELAAYAGTYQSDIYGPLEVTSDADGALVLTLGPAGVTFTLSHYDGDTYWFMPTGENAVNPSGVVFDVPDGSDTASAVTIEWLEGEAPGRGIGTFTRG